MPEVDWGINAGMDPKPPSKTREEVLAETPADIREEAERMLINPELLDLAVAAVGALGVAGEHELVATLYLLGVSRLLPRPLAAILQGPSSSGKSYLIEKVAQLFPDEAVSRVTDMTANALYYAAPGSLCHKFVVAGERGRRQNDDTAAGTKALREMISSGKLVKSVVVKNMFGEPETRTIEQEGPIAFVESTTATNIFEEDRNRCLMLHTDEQPEQTRKILKVAAKSQW